MCHGRTKGITIKTKHDEHEGFPPNMTTGRVESSESRKKEASPNTVSYVDKLIRSECTRTSKGEAAQGVKDRYSKLEV